MTLIPFVESFGLCSLRSKLVPNLKMSELIDGVHVVTVNKDELPTYRLDEEALKKILLNDEIKDLPVALISVAGAFRGGKSFLLNFFLKYLSSTPSARQNGTWIGAANEELTGFSWRGGSERNTTGILMWPQPFIITTQSNKKVAVLLMDTQGTFDSTSTVRNCSTIFALSTLLASVQIYNLKENIKEDDLSNLQLFTDYGKLMRDKSGNAFQILEFLVRDWMFPYEYAYGQEGGEKFLKKKLEISATQPAELQELRHHIIASFDKVTCFLMPHPGLVVRNPTFKGKPMDIAPEFITALDELTSNIFSPSTLVVKQVAGMPVKSKDLFNYFKSYMTIFNSDTIPTPKTILAATAEAGLLMAANEAREQYENNMELACGTSNKLSMPAEMVMSIHDQQLAAARATFKSKKLFGEHDEIDRKLESLVTELSKREKEFLEINKSKTLQALEAARAEYKAELEKLTDGKLLCVHARDLMTFHEAATTKATAKFDELRTSLPSGTNDEIRVKFVAELKNDYYVLRLTNEQNNNMVATEVKNDYFQTMVFQCNKEPKLNDDQYKDEHDKAYANALSTFDSKRNKISAYAEDVYRENLEKNLQFLFTMLKQINASGNTKGFQLAMLMYDQSTMSVSELRKHCLHPDDLKTSHDNAVCAALLAFRPERTDCAEGFHDTDKDEKILKNLFKNRYEAMFEINKTANEMAVQEAFATYKTKFDELSGHWYYVFQTWATADNYHKEALDKALETFYSLRRDRNWHEKDQYLSDLKAKSQQYYHP